MSCPICETIHAVETPSSSDKTAVDCQQCGRFAITDEARVNSRKLFERWKVSAWIREYLQQDVLDAATLDSAESAQPPNLEQRVLRMLRFLAQQYPMGSTFHFGQWWAMNTRQDPPTMIASPLKAIGWCKDLQEEDFLFQRLMCEHLGWVKKDHMFQLTAKAFFRLELAPQSEPVTGFVAMWFSPEVRLLWTDVIEPAIRQAGFEPLRIDGKEHNGKIDDEIMVSIRASKFVVSDFTGHRGGVYYEAGFAHGLGLPVIFLCRESDMKDLHFDIRQYNCIIWSPDKLEAARGRLKNRILATLGQGSLLVQ